MQKRAQKICKTFGILACSAATFRIVVRLGGKPGVVGRRKTAAIVIASLVSSQWLRVLPANTRSTLCFYTLVRAADVTLGRANSAPGLLFVVASFVIMRDWFYDRGNLPRAYAHWISKMADMDEDLISALRKLKEERCSTVKNLMLFLPTANDMASTNLLLILNVLFLTVSSIPKMAIVLCATWQGAGLRDSKNRSGYMYPFTPSLFSFGKGPFLLAASFVP